MALVVADRIKETTSTTGTGTYTLGGASTGFEAFSVIGNGNTTYYCCTDGTDFEVGIGTYTLSGTTLARTTILQSSNSDSAINWGSGTRDIFVTQPAEKAVYRDASGYIDAFDGRNLTNLNASNVSSGTLSEDRLPSGGAGADTYGSTANGTKIDTITLDAKGRVTAVATGTTGDILGVTAGTGLSGGGSSGTVTLNLDFSELTDMTGDISGTTEFILQNGTTESRKAASEIGLSAFDNDAGFTTNTGDITGVTAGTGLSGGGASGSVTLNVSGLTVSELAADSLTTSAESFADNDTTLMTSAAINDRIESFGYSTTTGTVTSVGTTGTVNGITLTGTVTSSGNLTLGGTLGSITVSQLAGSALTTSAESFADNDTTLMTSAAINDRIESFGYTTNTGDITGVTAGTGLSGGGDSGSVTLAVDLSELTDMTQTIVGTDEFIVLDNGADRRKAANEIPLSIFNNDSAFITASTTDTLTNKTLTTPVINGFSGTGNGSITGDLTLISTDAGSASDPEMVFFRNSASPADSDALGKFVFKGNNSAAEETQYAAIVSRLTDATDGTEDGTFELQTISGGSIATNVRLDASSTVGIRLLNGGERNIRFDTGTAFNGSHIDLAPASATGARTVTLPDATGTVSLLTNTETLTNKTLTTPVINGFSGTGDGTITGNLNIISTDAGATADPQLVLYRNSSSPADNDILANIDFKGKNSAAEETVYAAIQTKVTDVTDGTEDANYQFKCMSNGSLVNVFNIKGNGDSQFLQNDLALMQGVNLKFEGSSSNSFETTLTVVNPTADRTVTLPNVSGTVLTTGNSDTPATTTSSSDADFVLIDDGGTMKKITPANLGIPSDKDYGLITGSAASTEDYGAIT